MKTLNKTELEQYAQCWLELSRMSDNMWDDIYEWIEQDYMSRFDVNKVVATALYCNVKLIVFGRSGGTE